MINLPLEYLKRKMRLEPKEKPKGKLEIVVFGCDKDVFPPLSLSRSLPAAYFCKCLLSR